MSRDAGSGRGEPCGAREQQGVAHRRPPLPRPNFKPTRIRTLKGEVDPQGKGYFRDFMNEGADVDGDGRLDVVSCDWFQKHLSWFRNPGPAGGDWPETVLDRNGNFEHGSLLDVDGDGRARGVVPVVAATVRYEWAPRPGRGTAFVKHVVSVKVMNWGVGVCDANGDGRPDLVRPDAWFEAPADPRQGAWVAHPIALGHLQEGKADHTAQILVHDVNGDGLNDLICSSAHGYGIFWYEQVRQGGQVCFRRHLIDATWTQAHALTLADLDGDGVPELITGKRFMAHNGADPDEGGPPGVYVYRMPRGRPGPGRRSPSARASAPA